MNARYGQDPIVKLYTHISDRYAPFHVKVITGTSGEAIHVLDGLVNHDNAIAWCLETFRQRPSAIVAMIVSKLNRSIRSRIAGTSKSTPPRNGHAYESNFEIAALVNRSK